MSLLTRLARPRIAAVCEFSHGVNPKRSAGHMAFR